MILYDTSWRTLPEPLSVVHVICRILSWNFCFAACLVPLSLKHKCSTITVTGAHKQIFFVVHEPFFRNAIIRIHDSGFIILKHICGAQNSFFPLHWMSFVSVWNWGVIWFIRFVCFCSNHGCTLVCQYKQIGMNSDDRCSLITTLVVLHGGNVDIWYSRFWSCF